MFVNQERGADGRAAKIRGFPYRYPHRALI